MKLSFFAKGNLLVSLPGQARGQGTVPRYVGRERVLGDGKTKGTAFPATRDPFVVDESSTMVHRLVEQVAKWRALLPADAKTAAACGVPFVETEFSDGEHRPVEVAKKRDGSPKNFERAARRLSPNASSESKSSGKQDRKVSNA
jgi:hypothetical protein